jgi:hypothetical protein
VSPVRYDLGSYIQEDDILHNYRLENLKSYSIITDHNFHSGPFCSELFLTAEREI